MKVNNGTDTFQISCSFVIYNPQKLSLYRSKLIFCDFPHQVIIFAALLAVAVAGYSNSPAYSHQSSSEMASSEFSYGMPTYFASERQDVSSFRSYIKRIVLFVLLFNCNISWLFRPMLMRRRTMTMKTMKKMKMPRRKVKIANQTLQRTRI